MILTRLTPLLVTLTVLPGLYNFYFPGKIVAIMLPCAYLFLLLMLFIYQVFVQSDHQNYVKIRYITIFLLYALWILIRGMVTAEDESDWKFMLTGYIPCLTITAAIFIGNNLDAAQRAFRTFLFLILPCSLLLYSSRQFYGYHDFIHMISPIYLFIFFLPFVDWKWRIGIIMLTVTSFFWNIEIRANLVNLLLAWVLSLLGCFLKFDKLKLATKVIRTGFLYMPFLLFFLGVAGIFNIFTPEEALEKLGYQSNELSQDLLVDSRTFLYEDTLHGLESKKSLTFGLSASGYCYSKLMEIGNFLQVYGKGRRATEVGILNYMLWGGAIFAILYFLLFYYASKYAISHANNTLSLLLCGWVSWLWAMNFMEAPNSFNIYTMFRFLAVGLCCCPALCKMNDDEVKIYLKTICTLSGNHSTKQGSATPM